MYTLAASLTWWRTRVQGSETFAWNSVYFALDDETARGLGKLVAPASKPDARARKGGLKSKLCFCGEQGADDDETPVGVQLEIASRSGEWRRVDVPSDVSAVMVENLPKRWAKGDDFWDGTESGVRPRR